MRNIQAKISLHFTKRSRCVIQRYGVKVGTFLIFLLINHFCNISDEIDRNNYCQNFTEPQIIIIKFGTSSTFYRPHFQNQSINSYAIISTFPPKRYIDARNIEFCCQVPAISTCSDEPRPSGKKKNTVLVMFHKLTSFAE